MITYEYPLNERIRTLLRLEDLGSLADAVDLVAFELREAAEEL